ncbi:hypothetical protein B0J17DRAFT_651691 [Rhizoctonia solani]|nr:hypothetical protein B0J17DRAFT_651691 [Rhizoctonia solani]
MSSPAAISHSRLNPSFRSTQPQDNVYSYFFGFGRERRTTEEVKQWYQSLQRDRVPTEFLSIAYMKDQGTNFEHEFLLVYLLPTDKDTPDDYSFVCRVERTGNGSRSQALFTGDYAHDTVQIFSKDAYTKFDLSYSCPAQCVLNIRFQQRLDLLRILELCYSMQESDTSARYTLLQFNCYFMCWMTLINLIRGVDKWEGRIGKDAWATIVTQQLPQLVDTWMLQDLRKLPSSPTPYPLKKVKHPYITRFASHNIAQYLCFRVLVVVLGTESHRVVKMITDSIQSELGSARDQLLGAIDNRNSDTLFPSGTQLYETIRQALSVRLNAAAAQALRQDKCAGEILWSLLSDKDSPQGCVTNALQPELEAGVAKKLHKMWFECMWGYLDSDNSGQQSKLKPGLAAPHTSANILSLFRCTRKSLVNPSYLNFKHWEFYRKQILPVVLSYRADIQTASQAISQDYRILAMYALLHPEATNRSKNPVEPMFWLSRCFKSSDWSYCLSQCVSKAIHDFLILLDRPQLQVERMQNGTTIQQPWRYIEFYDFVKARIEAHAIMVARRSTGTTVTSRAIQDGIHEAIKEIWDSRVTFSEENPA